MKATTDQFSALLSQDEMIADEIFDCILFSNDTQMNYTILDMMKHFKNNQKMLCQCLQLISLRCSQNEPKRFSSRPQTKKEQKTLIEGIVDCLNNTSPSVRLEALIALEDILLYPKESLIEDLKSKDLPFVFDDKALLSLVLERIETCFHDPNKVVAKTADNCLASINSNVLNDVVAQRAKECFASINSNVLNHVFS